MRTGQTNHILTHLHRLALLQERGGMTDAQLLERFLTRREEVAFEELVRRHGPMVLGVCRRVLGEPHDAADAFQATFLVFVRRAASIVPRSRVGPWLYGVARRTALKARSSAARRRRAEQEAAHGRPYTTPPADTEDDLRPLLDEELGRLPEKYRVPLVLCLLAGKSRKEAAGLLGWSEGTLSGRLARAKKLLGVRLRQRGVSLTGTVLLTASAESAATAAVPSSLVVATMKAAASLAGPTAANAIAIPIVALTEEVLKAMMMSKLKVAVGVLVLMAGVGLGTGAVTWQYRPAAQGAAAAEPDVDGRSVAAPQKKAEAKAGAVTGQYVGADTGQYVPVAQGAVSAEAGANRRSVTAPQKKAEAKPRAYVEIEPPDILFVKYAPLGGTDLGMSLVRSDGTISLGQFGRIYVSGYTPEEARGAIAACLARRLDGFDLKKLAVEVLARNSKYFYVIVEGAEIHPFPATGGETVLDAIVRAKVTLIGLGQNSICVERKSDDDKGYQVLPVDWEAITQGGNSATNYVLRPGDRVCIKSASSDPVRELEAILKALREARSQKEQWRIVESLEVLTRKLRKQLKKPEGASYPWTGQ